jgi:hypothetical protein
MKTYGGSKDIAPPFLTSVLDRGEWSASSFGRTAPLYPLDRRPAGPQNQTEFCGEEKRISLQGI